jgi:chloride channel 7
VGDGTGVKPIYESLIEVKNLPYLESSPDGLMHHITAAEAAGKPPVTFQRVERVFTLLNTLKTTTHNGFPVIATGADGESYIMGIILKSQLLVLLRSRRCFQPSAFVSEVSSSNGHLQMICLAWPSLTLNLVVKGLLEAYGNPNGLKSYQT